MAQITRKPVDPGVMIRTGTGKGQPRMASFAELAKVLALKINGGGSGGGSSVLPANPTATAGDVAVNGVLGTFMRSDAAPAVQKCDSSHFGLAKPDNSTITASGGILSSALPGGYIKGTVPPLVQVAYSVSGGNSITFGVAPTNLSLLVAICFNPTSDTTGSGWTQQVENITGTDYGVILTKVCGGSESTTQSPLSGVSTTGCMIVWELGATGGITPSFIIGQTQPEQTGVTNLPVLIPNSTNCMALAAGSGVNTNITHAVNFGSQDAFDNTNANRKFVAGHTDISQTPMAGMVFTFATSAQTKCATCLVSS